MRTVELSFSFPGSWYCAGPCLLRGCWRAVAFCFLGILGPARSLPLSCWRITAGVWRVGFSVPASALLGRLRPWVAGATLEILFGGVFGPSSLMCWSCGAFCVLRRVIQVAGAAQYCRLLGPQQSKYALIGCSTYTSGVMAMLVAAGAAVLPRRRIPWGVRALVLVCQSL